MAHAAGPEAVIDSLPGYAGFVANATLGTTLWNRHQVDLTFADVDVTNTAAEKGEFDLKLKPKEAMPPLRLTKI